MKHFRTDKGTELPLMDMRGKDYLQVAFRIVWMRESHPDWSIETEFLVINDKEAVAKATIRNESGRILATSHKSETMKDFPAGHSEKAETGAIGRALALCGYGTQFAPDLDEGERIVDSPVARAKRSPEYDQFVEWATERGLEPPYVKGFVKELFGKESVSELSNVETFDLMRAISEARGEFDAEDRSLGIPLPQNKRLHPQGGITS